jgi:hypothetical protein
MERFEKARYFRVGYPGFPRKKGFYQGFNRCNTPVHGD